MIPHINQLQELPTIHLNCEVLKVVMCLSCTTVEKTGKQSWLLKTHLHPHHTHTQIHTP